MAIEIENVNQIDFDPPESFKFDRAMYDEIKRFVLQQSMQGKIKGQYNIYRLINTSFKLVNDSMDIMPGGAIGAWRQVQRVVYGE